MFVKVIAVLCHLANPQICLEETVTDSNMQEDLTMGECLHGLARTVKWHSEHPSYQSYRLSGWKCQIGNREPPPPAGRA
jgi:hypothetical protein